MVQESIWGRGTRMQRELSHDRIKARDLCAACMASHVSFWGTPPTYHGRGLPLWPAPPPHLPASCSACSWLSPWGQLGRQEPLGQGEGGWERAFRGDGLPWLSVGQQVKHCVLPRAIRSCLPTLEADTLARCPQDSALLKALSLWWWPAWGAQLPSWLCSAVSCMPVPASLSAALTGRLVLAELWRALELRPAGAALPWS